MEDEPFLGELRLMSFERAPRGWALCNGQLLPKQQNEPLFSLLGTTYGGDGVTNFALPDLRGRLPLHAGDGLPQGTRTGAPNHTVTVDEMPAHSHLLMASSRTGTESVPAGAVLAANRMMYTGFPGETQLGESTIARTGGSQPHSNTQPYLVLNWMIALNGIFPSRP